MVKPIAFFKRLLIIVAYVVAGSAGLYAAVNEIPIVGNKSGEIEGSGVIFSSAVAFQMFGGNSLLFTQNSVLGYPEKYFLHERFIPLQVRVTNTSEESIILDAPFIIKELRKVIVPFPAFRDLCASAGTPLSTWFIKICFILPELVGATGGMLFGSALLVGGAVGAVSSGEPAAAGASLGGGCIVALSALWFYIWRNLWRRLPQKKDIPADFMQQALLEKEVTVAPGETFAGLLIVDGYKTTKKMLFASKYHLKYKVWGTES